MPLTSISPTGKPRSPSQVHLAPSDAGADFLAWLSELKTKRGKKREEERENTTDLPRQKLPLWEVSTLVSQPPASGPTPSQSSLLSGLSSLVSSSGRGCPSWSPDPQSQPHARSRALSQCSLNRGTLGLMRDLPAKGLLKGGPRRQPRANLNEAERRRGAK